MEQLPQELLTNFLFPFVGGGQFRFVAGVNRSFYQAYSTLFPKKQTYLRAITTLEQVQLCDADLVLQSQLPPTREEIIRKKIISRRADWLRSEKKCLRVQLLKHCVKLGRLDMVQYLRDQGCPPDTEVCATAAFYGQIEMLQWLFAHGCPWDEKTASNAASQGHLGLLKWARRNGCPWSSETTEDAARGGHLPLLKWAVGNGCPLRSLAFIWAAEKGQLHVIKWLRSYGLKWDKDTLSFAAFNGHIDVVKWAYEHGCHWDDMICTCSAFNGHLELLQWAHEYGFSWDERTCAIAAAQGHEPFLELDDCSFSVAGQSNNIPRQRYLDVLRFAHENGCPWDEMTCANAAYSEDLELLQYAHENGCQWDQQTCSNAAEKGNLNVLKYAHENGCPWDKWTCSKAALHGLLSDTVYSFRVFHCDPKGIVPSPKYLETLRYAHEHGCPWDKDTCANAALADLALLQFARENGCPWDSKTCFNAAFSGNLEALKYAHENGCPWDQEVFKIAEERGHLPILQYIYDNDGPWDYTLIPEKNNVCMEFLLLAHKYALVHVECPSLDPLESLYDARSGVLGMDGATFEVGIFHRHVMRCFINTSYVKSSLYSERVEEMVNNNETV